MFTIDPNRELHSRTLNLDSPLEVKRNTPIGALDAVARSGELNYTTYYYTVSDKLVIDSINGYVYQEDQVCSRSMTFNETVLRDKRDTKEHNISDGETLCSSIAISPIMYPRIRISYRSGRCRVVNNRLRTVKRL